MLGVRAPVEGAEAEDEVIGPQLGQRLVVRVRVRGRGRGRGRVRVRRRRR